MEIEGIKLWLFGRAPRSRLVSGGGAEFVVAIAGALVSLALGVLFVGLAGAGLLNAADGVAAWLDYTNLMPLAFNDQPRSPCA